MEIVQNVPWSKLVYSIILIALAGVLLTELIKIWTDNRIYVGKFEFISGDGPQDAASKLFPTQVIGSQNILANQLRAYQSRRTNRTSADETFLLPGSDPLHLPPEALPGLDITYQEINFRQIFTLLRKRFTRPNEVGGIVTQSAGMIQVAVDWPKAPVLRKDEAPETRAFLTPPRSTAQQAAFQVACSLSWARAASRSDKVAQVPREQFCSWAETLNAYFGLDGKVKNAGVSSADDAKQILKLIADMGRLAGEKYVYPEVYRLRADLVDLLPDDSRRPELLVMAQEDRVRYSISKGDVSAPPGEERYATLALARPALAVGKEDLAGLQENWAFLLKPRMAFILRAARSTGYLASAAGTKVGTGFVVAPGLLMTASHVAKLQGAMRPTHFCTPSAGDCDDRFRLGKIVYEEAVGPSGVVLVEIEGSNPVLLPPLPISATADPSTFVGRYAFVVGYPQLDSRLPPAFLKYLLGDSGGQKRVMPGRVLAFGVSGFNSEAGLNLFTTDISTTGGTAGSPLVDLQSGEVFGLQFAGKWENERGKFAYAQPIPPAAVEIIKKRLAPAQAPAQPPAPAQPSAPPPGGSAPTPPAPAG